MARVEEVPEGFRLWGGPMGVELPLLGVFGEPRFVEAFSADRTIEAWLEVEVALARAQAEHGVIPASAAETIRRELAAVEIDLAQLADGTRLVGYPILPLLQQLSRANPEVAAWLHFGATTQDIMDTAVVLLLRGACRDVAAIGAELGDGLAALAEAHRATPMAGRTHGQQAVPITFGMKVAGWLEEVGRSLVRLGEARAAAEVVQLYGAAGTSAAYGPLSAGTRRQAAEILGLGCDDEPWHSIRDRFAALAAALGVLAAAMSRIALEVIDLARSEIAEVREGGGRLAGASSTMPQKANPIVSETIVGLSGMACALSVVPLRAMTGRHERSAGEWQMEWDSLPLLVAYTGSAVARCGDLIGGLGVDAARMAANLEADGGLIMAEALMMQLAPSLGRHEAHEVVYDLSVRARATGTDGEVVDDAVWEGSLSVRGGLEDRCQRVDHVVGGPFRHEVERPLAVESGLGRAQPGSRLAVGHRPAGEVHDGAQLQEPFLHVTVDGGTPVAPAHDVAPGGPGDLRQVADLQHPSGADVIQQRLDRRHRCRAPFQDRPGAAVP